MAASQRLQLRHRARGNADDVAAWRLPKEGGVEPQRGLGPDRWTAHPDTGEKAALCKRDQHSAIGTVVGRVEMAALPGHDTQAVHRPLPLKAESGPPAR